MELINEVPPIKIEGRIVACEGGIAYLLQLVYIFYCCYTKCCDGADSDPALGHPIEFICLDKKDPAICKYCGLRYVQHGHY